MTGCSAWGLELMIISRSRFLPRELLLRIGAILKRTYFYQNEMHAEPKTLMLGNVR